MSFGPRRPGSAQFGFAFNKTVSDALTAWPTTHRGGASIEAGKRLIGTGAVSPGAYACHAEYGSPAPYC